METRRIGLQMPVGDAANYRRVCLRSSCFGNNFPGLAAQFVKMGGTPLKFYFVRLANIMSISPARCTQLLVCTTLALASHAFAADPASASLAAPPQIQKLEEGAEIKPEKKPINIKDKSSTNKITEKKTQGRVTEIEVKQGKNTYYLKPNDTGGNPIRDAQSNAVRGAQWKVGEFGGPKDKAESNASSTPEASAKTSVKASDLAKAKAAGKASAPSTPDSLALPQASAPLPTK